MLVYYPHLFRYNDNQTIIEKHSQCIVEWQYWLKKVSILDMKTIVDENFRASIMLDYPMYIRISFSLSSVFKHIVCFHLISLSLNSSSDILIWFFLTVILYYQKESLSNVKEHYCRPSSLYVKTNEISRERERERESTKEKENDGFISACQKIESSCPLFEQLAKRRMTTGIYEWEK